MAIIKIKRKSTVIGSSKLLKGEIAIAQDQFVWANESETVDGNDKVNVVIAARQNKSNTFSDTNTFNGDVVASEKVTFSSNTAGKVVEWTKVGGLKVSTEGLLDDQNVVNKAYVDERLQGLKIKPSVKLATTANITIKGLQSIDGVAVAIGDRILVRKQTLEKDNGIYIVTNDSQDWPRAHPKSDLANAFVFVESGSSNSDTGWVCTTDSIGVDTAVVWSQFSGAGTYTNGNGITLTGNSFSINTSVTNAIAANTAKIGITTAQASAIVANTAKIGITTAQANAIVANTAKTGITTDQASAIVANTAKIGITTAQANAIVANTAKTGITTDQASAIVANTAKTGITTDQANAIVANTIKTDLVNFIKLDYMQEDQPLISAPVGTTWYKPGENKYKIKSNSINWNFTEKSIFEDMLFYFNGFVGVDLYDGYLKYTNGIGLNALGSFAISTSLTNAIAANTAKTGITTAQASAIVANTAKIGITTAQANAIVANTAKTGITTDQASAIVANTAKTGITTDQANAIVANTIKTDLVNFIKLDYMQEDQPLISAPVGTTWYKPGENKYKIKSNSINWNFTEKSIFEDMLFYFNGFVGVDLYDGYLKYTNGIGLNALGSFAISTSLTNAIAANTAKTGITTAQANAIVANTAKTGITTAQANAIVANTAKTGITTDQANAIVANTAKIGITTAQANAIVANTAKTGITTDQANAIVANTAKIGITTAQANAIVANTAKTGITTDQASAIVANTAKTGITTDQASAIVANTAKVGITEIQASKVDLIKIVKLDYMQTSEPSSPPINSFWYVPGATGYKKRVNAGSWGSSIDIYEDMLFYFNGFVGADPYDGYLKYTDGIGLNALGSFSNTLTIASTLTSFTPYGSKDNIRAGDSIFTAFRKLEQRVALNDVKISNQNPDLSNYAKISGTNKFLSINDFSVGLKVTGGTKAAGMLYAGTTVNHNPSSTTRLNYDGYFHATQFEGLIDCGTWS